MKKETILSLALSTLLFTSFAQIPDDQDLEANVNNISETADQIIDDKIEMKDVIEMELKKFTEYLSQTLHYSELATAYNLQGIMTVRVTFDGEIKAIRITKSLSEAFDKVVIEKIKEYAKNWDAKEYENIPELTFEIPIQFKLKG